MYWAWKNLQADYYGLFHYRRFFDFSGEKRKIQINNKTMKNIIKCLHLNPKNIQKKLVGVDLIKPFGVEINPYEHYKMHHYQKDLDLCIDYILKKYPEMKNSVDEVFGDQMYDFLIANMFVMRKEIYFEYCTWLFDVLFEVKKFIPYETYNSYQKRVFGFLSERLFNVWIEHNSGRLKTKRMQIINLDEIERKRKFFGWDERKGVRRFYFCGIRIVKQILPS